MKNNPILLFTASILAIAPAMGNSLIQENFDYGTTAGSMVAANGGTGFSAAWTQRTTTGQGYNPTNLTSSITGYTNTGVSGANGGGAFSNTGTSVYNASLSSYYTRQFPTTTLSTTDGTTVWFSFLGSVSSLNTASGSANNLYFKPYYEDVADTVNANLFAGNTTYLGFINRTSGGNGFQGTSNYNVSPSVSYSSYSNTYPTLSTSFLVVGRYTRVDGTDNDQMDVWFNPTDVSSIASTVSTAAFTFSVANQDFFNSYKFMQGISVGARGDGLTLIDSIRLSYGGTSDQNFQSVMTGVAVSDPTTAVAAFRTDNGLASDGSDDLLTPANDGVSNLAKFAFNMIGAGTGQAATLATPNASVLAPDGSAGLPLVSVGTGPDAGKLQITYIRRKSSASPAPGITYAVQFSNDLGVTDSWAVNGSATETATSIDATLERVTITDSTTPAKRFGRVRVTAP